MSDGPGQGCGADVGSAVEPCPPPIPDLTMHVDADRDGTVDDDISGLDQWNWGENQKGAVILVNNDDDGGNRRLDNSNGVVDGSDDESDLAPLVLKRNPPGLSFPPGYTARLSVSDRQKIRIFKKGSWTEFIGPGTPQGRNTITDLGPQRIEFGMEALQYPGQSPDRNFDGLVTLTLEVLEPGGGIRSSHQAQVRVAPWLMPNHLNQTVEVYVVETRDNSSVRTELTNALDGADAPTLKVLSRNPHGEDRWIQDAMEIGFSSLPNSLGSEDWHLPVVMPAARKREGQLHAYPKRNLLGAGYGYTEAKPPTPSADSLDSFGNLECSPPVTANSREFKFGRILYGHDGSRPMMWAVRRFLQMQKVQEPVPIDTSWLAVGHVDEIFSPCPWAGHTKKFKMLIGSPAKAISILQTLRDDLGQGSAPLFLNINPRLGYRLRTVDAILNDDAFVRMNRRVQEKIDSVKNILGTNLGLVDEDFVPLPVLFSWYVYEEEYCDGTTTLVFQPDGSMVPACSGTWRTRWRLIPRWHVAYTGNVINMLVVTKGDGKAKLVIPKPFGPVVNGMCQFEREVQSQLTGSGNDITFIDCFLTYHHMDGEIHCGTNSKRKPPIDRWWWQQLVTS
ncbi:MAG: hypothetical protein FJ117_02195 [Deltaproteobacteria bacterium]|nr:hypothetical protein [Deltaproteobacteria bacterium]